MRRDVEHYEQQALDALERAYTAPDGPDGTAHLHLGKAQVYAALAQAAALHQARPGVARVVTAEAAGGRAPEAAMSWPREVRDRALRLYRQHGPTAASQTTGVPATTIAGWAHKAHYRPAGTCDAREASDQRACGEPVHADGFCYEHYWRARWPLPLPAHIPAEPAPRWREQAPCRHTHAPDDYFPVSHGDAETPPGHVVAACAGCPVRASCIAVAVATLSAHLDRQGMCGIWGSTPAQRTQLRHTTPLERRSA